MIKKDWVALPPHSQSYKDGVNYFLDIAFTKGMVEEEEILCPCAVCCNDSWESRDVVYDHLCSKGFVKGYMEWIYHGEDESLMDLDGDSHDETSSHDDINGLLFETFKDVAEGGRVHEGLNEDAKKFYKLVDDANQELYPGCESFSSLSFTIRIYLLKCLHGWSNASFTALLELLKEAMPDLNIPVSFNKTKSMIKDLGLDYKKIDACPKNCMLFWKEHEKDDSCHICGASRWIEYPEVANEPDESKKAHKVPAKVLRHFPLIPRLKRLFMCSKTADTLRWHSDKRSRDGKLRHPADAKAWKDFDAKHSDFARETRNIRLGLASDGFNPFRTMSLSHSTWPVVLTIYNYPPNLCLKAENCLMSLIIPGPKSPGNAIDVYLQPLIEELKILWNVGVETYDISKNETFQMHAALMWTVNDYPAYAMLSGWSTKGKLACPACNHKTSSRYLKHSRKMCYMGHRVFLDSNHVWRSNSTSFDGKPEYRSAPSLLDSKKILKDLKKIPDMLGKKKKKKRFGPLGKKKKKKKLGPWKKKSIFWQLPYWKDNSLRHNLDVMHIEKNICDNIIGTLLEIEGKKKDHAKARLDLQHMGIRKKLHLKATSDGKKTQIPKACFSLTKQEKSVFCGVLKTVKLPDGLASNISRCVQVNEGKVSGYKSHDAHIILHYLLQVAIRGIGPNQVVIPLLQLCSFFRCLCQKVIDVKTLDRLEVEIAETLCQFERIFPPSFFDIMVHLPIHLANEVRLGGPVQFRWMYYMERYLGDLKSFVRNRRYPEGSIAEAYVAKEGLTFCSRYLSSAVDTGMNRMTRNSDDTPSIGHPIGGKQLVCFDHKDLNQAHGYILFNCDEVQEYIREHEVNVHNPKKRRKSSKAINQREDFIQWFETRVMDEEVTEWLKVLSRGPNEVVKSSSLLDIMDNVRSVKAGGSHRPTSQSPAEGFDLPFQARSSVELKKMYQHQIKQEKIEKLHERLQGNNREMPQGIVEVVDETPKKGTQQEQVQKVDGNLDKDTMTKKLKKAKLSQPQPMKDDAHRDKEVVQQIPKSKGTQQERVQKVGGDLDKDTITKKFKKAKLSQPQAMKDYAHGDKEVVQQTQKRRTNGKATINGLNEKLHAKNRVQEVATKQTERPRILEPQAKKVFSHGNKDFAQGMLKKRTHENLLDNNREKIQKVDKTVARKILIPSKIAKPDKPNISLDTMMSKTECSKKAKRVPTCPSMLIHDYVELHKSKEMEATKSNNGEKPRSNFHPSSSKNQPLSSKNRVEDSREPVVNEEEVNTNKEEEQGISQRKTRGRTLCKKIHARTFEERVEVTFNDVNQPIGPTKKVVSDFSLFLGTLARNSTFCPLKYTNWSGMPEKNKDRIWRYANRKFILSVESRDWVETTVRDAWRRYKYKIKKYHFLKYPNMTERLKHRPAKVPIAHFRELCEFWSKEPIQALAESNAKNRGQLKWLHRMGPQSFSLTREKLREKEKREPTQSEMFFETRKGSRGKQLDEETGKVFSQLQEMVEKKGSDTEAFKAVMGKERPGRLRCYGRTVTKTSLKRKVEINALKQAHSQEVSTLRHEFQDQIDKLQNAFKTVIQQCNPQLNMESIEHLLGLSHGDANSSPKDSRAQMHSSASIHTPCHGKQVINEDVVQDDIDEEFQEEDVDDEFLEDEFLEDNLSDEFQEDDVDDEFQEDDVDDEFQEDDIGDEFEVDDMGDELQDKLE